MIEDIDAIKREFRETLNAQALQDGLSSLLRAQGVVSGKRPGCLEPTPDNVRVCMLAITEEAHELGRELNWRNWHEPKPVDKGRALEEYADILAFAGLMGIYVEVLTGCSTREMAAAYAAKSEVTLKKLFERFHSK